ncbi:MAG: endonuclease domain-containing protein [Microvirga sp.]
MRGANRPKTAKARHLRRAQTDAERRLWYRLNNRQLAGHKFVRQEPIGPYFADFVCRERKLVVELDGSQHAESEHDQVRDAFLVTCGYRVLRFWNRDVMQNLNSVLDTIFAVLEPGHFLPESGDEQPPAGHGDDASRRSPGEGLALSGHRPLSLNPDDPSPARAPGASRPRPASGAR